MGQQGVWEISEGGPRRLRNSAVDLERHLEEWIENDPSLVQGGLTIVARQLQTEAGPLDLLALDPQGRWVVIEVKRGVLRREAVTQAIDYASAICSMTLGAIEGELDTYLECRGDGTTLRKLLSQRQVVLEPEEVLGDVSIIVVGTGRDQGLDRIVTFLSKRGSIAITVVSFEVFELAGGRRVLVREISEDEGTAAVETDGSRYALAALLSRADAEGTGKDVRAICQAAQRLGLHPRPWKVCLMFAPPSNKTRCLFTVWTKPTPENDLTIWVNADAFDEFYQISRQKVVKALPSGVNSHSVLPRTKVQELIAGLSGLLTPASE